MNRILKVTKLHLNKGVTFLMTPLMILAVVFVVSIIISLALQRTGVDPTSAEYIQGARFNSAVVWSLPGFLVYYGVQGVATTYPFGLALGATRRNFILGTLVANAIQAAYIALLLLALLGLELLTNHWFASIYVLDVYALGAGNGLVLVASAFVAVLLCLTIGGFFGAIWVRFGAKGPAIAGLALGLVIAVLVLVFAPQLGEIFAAITRPAIAGVSLAVLVLAMLGTWLAMRRAAVR